MNSKGQQIYDPVFPVIIFLILLIGISIFWQYYNSPSFVENICRDVKVNFGNDCNVVVDLDGSAKPFVLVDNNWVYICDSNIGNYCNMVN